MGMHACVIVSMLALTPMVTIWSTSAAMFRSTLLVARTVPYKNGVVVPILLLAIPLSIGVFNYSKVADIMRGTGSEGDTAVVYLPGYSLEQVFPRKLYPCVQAQFGRCT